MTIPRLLRDRRLWIAVGVLGAVLALRQSGLADHLSLHALAEHRAALTRLVAENAVLAGLAYLVLYVAVVALSVPGGVFLTLAGGFLFGAVVGRALTVAGAGLGATLVFLLARTVLGENALDRLGAPAQRLAEGIRRNAASYLLVLRLVPLFPFFLVNPVPAFVGVRLRTYVVTTFVGILPGTAVYSLAGAGLGDVLDAGGTFDVRSVMTPRVLGALLGLAALALAAVPLNNRFART